MKILLVEDDYISQSFLKKMVETMGFEAIVAGNGNEALDQFQQTPVRFMITDWSMPEMDGLTLCRKIRDIQTDYVYIIVVTAKDQRTDAVKGLQAGADDFIAKPVDPEELKARIRSGQRILHLEDDLKRAGAQLLQSEKMASIGQLAAGVAHEINNPTGFVMSNLKTMGDYVSDLLPLIGNYRQLVEAVDGLDAAALPAAVPELVKTITSAEKDVDIAYLMEDIQDLIKDCQDGTERIKKIVMDLKDFAHPGENKLQQTDINAGLHSTLNVVNNEIKYKADVIKTLGDLPLIVAYPHLLNQVFVNLLVNAAQAIPERGEIRIQTRTVDDSVEIRIEDTGCGIPPEHIPKLFDPFFTTKEVGKGTGLGLNVVYNIVTKHDGTIRVESTVGQGTVFEVRLPIAGPANGNGQGED